MHFIPNKGLKDISSFLSVPWIFSSELVAASLLPPPSFYFKPDLVRFDAKIGIDPLPAH